MCVLVDEKRTNFIWHTFLFVIMVGNNRHIAIGMCIRNHVADDALLWHWRKTSWRFWKVPSLWGNKFFSDWFARKASYEITNKEKLVAFSKYDCFFGIFYPAHPYLHNEIINIHISVMWSVLKLHIRRLSVQSSRISPQRNFPSLVILYLSTPRSQYI